jgi:hypothetical protein
MFDFDRDSRDHDGDRQNKTDVARWLDAEPPSVEPL